jgi:hypothetical protein
MQAGPGVAVLVLVLQPGGLRRGPNVLLSWGYAGRKICARGCVCRHHDERKPDDQSGQGMNRVPQHPSTCAKVGKQSQLKQTKT